MLNLSYPGGIVKGTPPEGGKATKKARLISAGFTSHSNVSDRAGNLAAAQTTGACVGVLRNTVNDNLHALHVRLPHAVGTSVRMAHLDAESDTLFAKITLCHLMLHLLASVFTDKQLIYNSKSNLKMQEKFLLFSDFFCPCDI